METMEWIITLIVIICFAALLIVAVDFYSRRIRKTLYQNHYIIRLAEKYEKDNFEFYKAEDNDWWWKRLAVNNELVGASTEGYKNKKDCIENAERNGFVRWIHKNNL